MLPNGPHDLTPEEVLQPSRTERRWPLGLITLVFYLLVILIGWAAFHPAALPAGERWLLSFKNQVASTLRDARPIGPHSLDAHSSGSRMPT